MEENNEKIISSHIFMFPFRIKHKNEGENKGLDISNVFNAFIDAGWTYTPYNPFKTALHYNDYFFFYEYVRKAIFEKRSIDEINRYFEGNDTAEFISYTFTRQPGNDAQMVLHIKDEQEPLSFTLSIKNITLKLFETGIGIISIALHNYTYRAVSDILIINDFGRRIYPQFLSEENGIETTKTNFLADKIEFQCQDINSDQCLHTSKFFNKNLDDIVVVDYMTDLMGKQFCDRYNFIPIIDDRMYTVCWFGHNYWSNYLKQNKGTSIAYETSDEWYKLIFVDGKNIGCACEKMKKMLIEEATYNRWIEYGTFYGISRYSMVCLTNAYTSKGCFPDILRTHMSHQYYHMAVILLAQRASILKFSADVSQISGDIETLTKQENIKEQRDQLDEIAMKVKKLHSAFIRFINRLWFTEITPQEQGIEMHAMAVKAMGLKELVRDLKNEIKELYEFVEMSYERLKSDEDRKINKKLSTLNMLAAVFLPLTVIGGLLGMNLYFINFLFPPESYEDITLLDAFIKYGGSFVVFVIIFFMIYIATNNLLSFVDSEQDTKDLFKLTTLRKVLFKRDIIIAFLIILFLVIAGNIIFM
jgi:hypothetical protein